MEGEISYRVEQSRNWSRNARRSSFIGTKKIEEFSGRWGPARSGISTKTETPESKFFSKFLF
jgi:hypothetical protein